MANHEREMGKGTVIDKEFTKARSWRKRGYGALSAGSGSMAATYIGLAISNPVSKDRIIDESVAAVICLFYSYLAGRRAFKK